MGRRVLNPIPAVALGGTAVAMSLGHDCSCEVLVTGIASRGPLSSTNKTVKSRLWPWREPFFRHTTYTLLRCSLLARQRRVKAHRLLYHSTLGLRVIKKKEVTIEGGGLGVQDGVTRVVSEG